MAIVGSSYCFGYCPGLVLSYTLSLSVMVADDFNSDIKDFQDLNGEDLDNESSLFSSFRNFNDHLENPLCVPQDPIEDLEWYPNFRDNPISLNWLEFLDTPHQKKTQNCFESEQRQQTKDVILFQNKGYEKDVLFQNHGTEQQKCGILFQNKRIPSKNSEQLEYEDKFVKLSDIQNLPNPLSVQNKEERCFLDSSSSKKKPRRKRVCGSAWLKCAADFENLEGVSKRRCRHCKSEETPLWRNGPLGPKTLCNACGVRYKSGRLLPEYRPAASPTFDAKKHSNFHRRIIKKKGG